MHKFINQRYEHWIFNIGLHFSLQSSCQNFSESMIKRICCRLTTTSLPFTSCQLPTKRKPAVNVCVLKKWTNKANPPHNSATASMNTIFCSKCSNVQMKERSLYSSSACETFMGIYLAFHDGALSIKSRTLSHADWILFCRSSVLVWVRIAVYDWLGLILGCDWNWYLFCIRSHRCIGASSVLYLSLFYILLLCCKSDLRIDWLWLCVSACAHTMRGALTYAWARAKKKKIILRPKSRFNVFSFIQFNLVRRLQRLRTCLLKYYLRDISVRARARILRDFFFPVISTNHR